MQGQRFVAALAFHGERHGAQSSVARPQVGAVFGAPESSRFDAAVWWGDGDRADGVQDALAVQSTVGAVPCDSADRAAAQVLNALDHGGALICLPGTHLPLHTQNDAAVGV